MIRAQNAELRAANKALAESNAGLVARVAELEKKVNRHSGNSSMPPSNDIFGHPKGGESAPGGVGGAKPGRGERHEGRGLALTEDPGVVRDVFTEVRGGCAALLAGLEQADSLRYTRRQCTGIPPASEVVTETHWLTVGCGGAHVLIERTTG